MTIKMFCDGMCPISYYFEIYLTSRIMAAQPNHSNVLCRFRNLCVEEAEFESAFEYTMFLHGEEDRLRGLLNGLTPYLSELDFFPSLKYAVSKVKNPS